MSDHKPKPLTDEDLLEMMHLHENEGLPYAAIAERMGRTRNAVAGAISRVRREIANDSTAHLDGTMPPRWWKR